MKTREDTPRGSSVTRYGWNNVLSEEDREIVARLTNQFTRDLSQAVDDVAAKAKEQLVADGVIYSEWPKSEKQRLVDATSNLLGEALDFAKKFRTQSGRLTSASRPAQRSPREPPASRHAATPPMRWQTSPRPHSRDRSTAIAERSPKAQ